MSNEYHQPQGWKFSRDHVTYYFRNCEPKGGMRLQISWPQIGDPLRKPSFFVGLDTAIRLTWQPHYRAGGILILGFGGGMDWWKA